jgi:hypothetical protein
MHCSPELKRLGIPVGPAASGAGCAGGVFLEAQWSDIAAHRLRQSLAIPLSAFIFGTQTERRLKVPNLLVGSVVNGHRVNVGGCGVARIAGISPGDEPLSTLPGKRAEHSDSGVSEMSEATSNVHRMNRDDVVEPVDAALQALFALTAEHTADREKSDLIYDFILTCSSVNEWPEASRDRLAETCNYVIGLARSFRSR